MGITATIHAMAPGTMPNGEIIDSVELDKCWHAIHFLLSATADAGDDPSQFLLSGVPVPDIADVELFQNSADKVRRFAAFLESVSTSTLLGRCDVRRAGELNVYNFDFLEAGAHSYIERHVTKLREFTSRHAKLGHDFLVVIG